jgi:predicted transcriptional regulator
MEEEPTDQDIQAVKAGLAELHRGEVITLAELRRELAECRHRYNCPVDPSRLPN